MRYIIAFLFLVSCGEHQRFVEVEGAPGKDGKGCESVDADGGIFVICGNNEPVFIADGQKGDQGAVGEKGDKGETGEAGQDANPVRVVKFCPNDTPTYPTKFPEFGLVIDGNIYGVYSANGGFLALLPPGNYHSNAIGSSCNFRINADATVSLL